MPLYDYECQNCGHVVEVMHGVNASGPQACDRCGGPMRKLMSRVAIVFKGSGWAKNDARSAGSSGASKSATDTDSDNRPAAASSKTEQTSESKDTGSAAPAKPTTPAAPATD
jgi:putative FmdB family regulatory protein